MKIATVLVLFLLLVVFLAGGRWLPSPNSGPGGNPSAGSAGADERREPVLESQLEWNSVTTKADQQPGQESKQLRQKVRRRFEEWFPEQAAASRRRYGLSGWTDENQPATVSQMNLDRPALVLVHGLDEPGRLWMTLRPELMEQGFAVCEFTYPNDQAVADSASYLAKELKVLRGRGVREIQLVAHSMGGLVCRELLTSPSLYNGSGDGLSEGPFVRSLIMVAPPNHGSELARLRLGSEARDSFIRALEGESLFLGAIFDGAGEAGLDLTPDSEFLTELNSRPVPTGVSLTIIAGRAGPFTPEQIAVFSARLEKFLPEAKRSLAGEVRQAFVAASAMLGDGAVSLDSTRLEGVADYVVVDGNHLSMIRNLSMRSERMPPAIPVILDRLQRGVE